MSVRRVARLERTTLALLTFAIANAMFWHGGLDRTAWHLSLISIGLAAVLVSVVCGLAIPLAPLGLVRWALILIPAFAFLQTIPFPTALIALLSPVRANRSSGTSFMALSLDAAATWDNALQITGYVFAFLLTRHATLRLRTSAWLVAMPLMVLGGIEAALGFAQWDGANSARVAYGSYANRNHLAGLLEMILPFAIVYAATGLYALLHKGRQITGALKFCGGATLALAILVTLLRTLSRMGLIAALVSLAVMAILLRPRRMPSGWRARVAFAVIALVTIGALIALTPSLLIQRLGSLARVSTADYSAGERFRLWRESLPLLRDYPIFGCGLGAYATALDPYRDSQLSFSDYAHNDYLQYLIELGPLVWGLGLFCVFSVLRPVMRLARSAKSGERRFLAVASSCSLIAILTHSLAEFNLYIPANALVCSYVGGLAAGLTGLATSPATAASSASGRKASGPQEPRWRVRTAS